MKRKRHLVRCLNCGEPVRLEKHHMLDTVRPCLKCSFVLVHAEDRTKSVVSYRAIFYKRHGGTIYGVPEGALLIVADMELR